MKKIRASAHPVVATDYRFTTGGELAVGRNGELNASSKKDLMHQQQKFLAASARGELDTAENIAAKAEAGKQLAAAIMVDAATHRLVGERITDALFLAQNRQGFARKFLAKSNPATGSLVRFKLYRKDTAVVYSTAPTVVETQIAKDEYFNPPEGVLIARPYIHQVDLNQSPGDPLQEKYVEATEAIMVGEDRWWKMLADATVGMQDGNPLTTVTGMITPYTLGRLQSNVSQWGLKTPHLLIASDIYADIIGNSDFHAALSPIAKHELLLTGELATMYGMTVTSDAFRHEQHRVLNAGELYVIADSVNHGAYADRDSLQSAPIGIEVTGIPGRGWVITESWTAAIGSARSVSKAIRV